MCSEIKNVFAKRTHYLDTGATTTACGSFDHTLGLRMETFLTIPRESGAPKPRIGLACACLGMKMLSVFVFFSGLMKWYPGLALSAAV